MEPMLFRRNAGLERLEWSGCKAGESVIVRGRNRAEAWRVGSGFGAGAFPRPSASGGSVTPGCLLFPSEERSDEVSMPDTAPKTIRQPERLECAKDIRQHATFDACAV
jgi:hypothetical protein